MTTAIDPANADQAAYWNGHAGEQWTERQDIQDRVLSPVTKLLFEAADIAPGDRVLDVGCGCGDTTLEAAAKAGPRGSVLGVDISEKMLARARERAATAGFKVEFRNVDASADDFSGVRADRLISRFGVMFFANPDATFANLRRGLKPGGRLAFACWQAPKKNPWQAVPFLAMRHRVPPPAERGPEDPGPFSFADPERIRRILGFAGFADIDIASRSLEIDTAVGMGLETAVRSALEIGPVARALAGQPAEVHAAAEGDIREALKAYAQGDSVRLGASVWIVTARSP